jgi:phosphate transport system substrate-binding protein
MQVPTKKQWKWAIPASAGLAILVLVATACGGGNSSSSTATTSAPGASSAIGKDDKAQLTGAGATFPAPIYQAWFDDYNKKVARGVQVNYQSVGSGAGITQFTANTVDFGASDAPMADTEIAKAPDQQHLPTVVGADVMAYNISGVTSLKLDGPAIANIYLGAIKKWNDPALTALNPGVNLPGNDIQVAYRSDSSGTSFVFTDYLSKVSPAWSAGPGTSKAPKWPVGQGGQGNEGVTNAVKQTPNSIGYVELNYALANKLAFADVKNAAGKFVTPTLAAASAAAAGATVPDDYRVSIVNAPGDASYPITSFTYLLLYKTTGKCSQQTPLVDMLWWMYHDPVAIQDIKDQNYSPLPANLLPRIEATIKSLKCDGGTKASLKAG